MDNDSLILIFESESCTLACNSDDMSNIYFFQITQWIVETFIQHKIYKVNFKCDLDLYARDHLLE